MTDDPWIVPIERLSASMPATADVIECVQMAREYLYRFLNDHPERP